MANRIMLNETSYHGAGAIQEIATEAKARAYKKAFVCSDPDQIYSDIKANPTIENVQHRQRNRAFQLSQCRPRQVQQLRLRSTM